MERFDESLERPIDPVLDAEYIKVLGSLGLVDATIYNAPVDTPHPEDERWAVQVEYNPNNNCELGYD